MVSVIERGSNGVCYREVPMVSVIERFQWCPL